MRLRRPVVSSPHKKTRSTKACEAGEVLCRCLDHAVAGRTLRPEIQLTDSSV